MSARRMDIYEIDNKVADDKIIEYLEIGWTVNNTARRLGVPVSRVVRIKKVWYRAKKKKRSA